MATEEITIDELFVGLTRPATIMGIPYFAFVIELMAVGVVFLGTGNPLWLLVAIPAHGLLFLVSAANPAFFANLATWLKTSGRCMNRAFWGSASFSPVALKKWRK